MNIQTTEAQAWWIALADEIRPRDGLDVAGAMTAIKETYNFPVVPTGPAKPGGGYEFNNGVMRDGATPIVILQIGVYNDGLNINVPSNSTNAEKVLQKTLEIFYSFGVRKPITPPLHYYLSTIVADFESSLDSLMPSPLLAKISAALPIEGRAQVSSFNINIDKATIPARLGPINPSIFNIHRRVDVPYAQNRYFSQANMTTEDHIALLGEVEKLAGKSK
jgi:hypothetical protein